MEDQELEKHRGKPDCQEVLEWGDGAWGDEICPLCCEPGQKSRASSQGMHGDGVVEEENGIDDEMDTIGVLRIQDVIAEMKR